MSAIVAQPVLFHCMATAGERPATASTCRGPALHHGSHGIRSYNSIRIGFRNCLSRYPRSFPRNRRNNSSRRSACKHPGTPTGKSTSRPRCRPWCSRPSNPPNSPLGTCIRKRIHNCRWWSCCSFRCRSRCSLPCIPTCSPRNSRPCTWPSSPPNMRQRNPSRLLCTLRRIRLCSRCCMSLNSRWRNSACMSRSNRASIRRSNRASRCQHSVSCMTGGNGADTCRSIRLSTSRAMFFARLEAMALAGAGASAFARVGAMCGAGSHAGTVAAGRGGRGISGLLGVLGLKCFGEAQCGPACQQSLGELSQRLAAGQRSLFPQFSAFVVRSASLITPPVGRWSVVVGPHYNRPKRRNKQPAAR